VMGELHAAAAKAFQLARLQVSGVMSPLPALPDVQIRWGSGNTSFSTNSPSASTGVCDHHLWLTTVIVIFAVLFAQMPIQIVINDELSRGVVDTMQAHGLLRLGFWFGNFLVDAMFSLLLPTTLIIGIAVRDIQGFTNPQSNLATQSEQMAGLFFTVWFYVLVMQFWVYAVLVAAPHWKLGSHVLLQWAMTLAFWIVPLVVVLPIRGVGLALEHPGYPMLDGITPTYALWNTLNYKRIFSRARDPSGLVPLLMLLCIHPLLPLLLAVTVVRRPNVRNAFLPTNDGVPTDLFTDVDVARELRALDDQCAHFGRPADRGVALNHAWKKYDDGKVAVKGVTFGVHWGECFGLLGSNGAGKSTTMRMLQLELDVSGGAVTFGALPADHDDSLDATRQLVRQGICQQHDTLTPALTGEEHLHLYLRLRLGPLYNEEDWFAYVDRVVALVNLPPNRPAGAYSGGMKRKLATIISIFTGAKLICLDEPSTGLDPYARRGLWRIITAATRPTTATVLTTHLMEEADAVCSRISIVTDGLMRCLGNSQHLKSRFGSGYIASLLLTTASDPTACDRGMRNQFGDNCVLTKTSGTLRQYALGVLPSLATAYRTLEQCASEWRLERFAISQATLQQVFVAFAQNTLQTQHPAAH